MRPKLLFYGAFARMFNAVLFCGLLDATQAQTNFQRIGSFSTAEVNGPGTLIEGSDGTLYGTTGDGFFNNAGTIFKMGKTGGGYTLLHTFVLNGDDGTNPNGLIEGTDGVLYGTTISGGIDNPFGQYGFGTIFKLNKDGSGYTVL